LTEGGLKSCLDGQVTRKATSWMKEGLLSTSEKIADN